MNSGNPEMINLIIDGVTVRVQPGTRVIEAAEHAGVVVPHYCYHPGIPTRPAQCRMCLVEVEGQSKLQPSCVLVAQEGMVVRTESETARQARKSVIEFLLLNHPLDCPICDAAGQCMLQDFAFETRQLESRFEDAKQVLGRARIADDILYFADRCIVCTRCVRFMRDVAGDDSLIVAQRGHKAYIDTFPGRALEHAFRGNIVDVCPVGALVHEDFLFKPRAWEMDTASGICPGCSTGCNVLVGVRENQIVRLKPRYNADVNSYWMCDFGRKQLVMSGRGLRVEVPLVRRGGELEAVSWDEALGFVADLLTPGGGGTALTSPHESNETLYYLGRLLDILGIEGGGYRVEMGEEAALEGVPKLKLRSERAPNARGASLFGFSETEAAEVADSGCTIVVADALRGEAVDFGEGAEAFVYLGSHLSAAVRNATAILPITTVVEMAGSFTNFEGRVQKFQQAVRPPGVARPAWMVLSRLLQRLGKGTGVVAVETAFEAMAASTPEMADLSWSAVGTKGRLLRDAPAAHAGREVAS